MVKMIHHYTSLSSLALILKSATIRFTRVDLFDDVLEAQTHAGIDFGRRLFASCWSTNALEDIPQWAMYGDRMGGVRLSLGSVDTFCQSLFDSRSWSSGRACRSPFGSGSLAHCNCHHWPAGASWSETDC